MHELVLHVGSFLVVPCGQYRQTLDSPTLFTAYVYARGHWAQPFLRLPATNKVSKADALEWMCNLRPKFPATACTTLYGLVTLVVAGVM